MKDKLFTTMTRDKLLTTMLEVSLAVEEGAAVTGDTSNATDPPPRIAVSSAGRRTTGLRTVQRGLAGHSKEKTTTADWPGTGVGMDAKRRGGRKGSRRSRQKTHPLR